MKKQVDPVSNTVSLRRRDGALLIALCLGAFGYFYSLDPRFICRWQKPVFFWEGRFAASFLKHPGGLLEYLSAFLTQAMVYRWLGALILTLFFALLLWFSKRLLRVMAPTLAVPIFYVVPAAAFLSMTSLYTHPLAVTPAYLLVLMAAEIYWRLKQPVLKRMIGLLFMMIVLYYLSSAAVLLFVPLVTLNELIDRKNKYILLLPIAAVVMLLIADRYLFLREPGFAFKHLLPFHHRYRLVFAPYLWYAFFPLLTILGRFLPQDRRPLFDRSIPARVAQAIAAVAVLTAAALFSFSRFHYDLQKVDDYAAQRQWRALLKYMQDRPLSHRLFLFQTYRALYHQGILLDDLLSIPHQERAVKCLLMDKDFAMTARMEYSDFLMDVGHINEAEHWAYESLAHYGEAPEVLVRLAQTNMLKGNRAFAETCLRRLSQNPFYRAESKRLQSMLNAPTVTDPYLEGERRIMFREDFPQFTYHARVNLELWRRHNPANRMVFEYLVAYYLLTGNPKLFTECIDEFKTFGYKKLPRHVEEAGILYQMSKQNKTPAIGGYAFSQQTLDRFADYMKIMTKWRGDKEAAYKELKPKHGNTFWFYQMFVLRKLIQEKKASSEELS